MRGEYTGETPVPPEIFTSSEVGEVKRAG